MEHNILLQESRHCAIEEKMGMQINEIEETEKPDF